MIHMLYREINGISIAETEIETIVDEIIEILSQKNITHAIANMILDEVKDKLMNTIIKKDEEKSSTFGKNVKLQGYHQSNQDCQDK